VVPLCDGVRVVHVPHAHKLCSFGFALLGHADRLGLLVGDVIHCLLDLFELGLPIRIDLFFHDLMSLERKCRALSLVIFIRRIFCGAGDDERRAGLIDQDRVHFVDDRVVKRPLNAHLDLGDHIVAEIIKSEFIIRPERDVRSVGPLALFLRDVMLDHTHRKPQEFINGSHPVPVAASQIIVHGHKMHTLAFQSIQIDWKCRHKRFPFAGGHFGDLPLVKHETAQNLHIKVPHLGCPYRGFTHHGKSFGENIIERGAFREPLFELIGLCAKLCIRKLLDLGLKSIHFGHDRPKKF